MDDKDIRIVELEKENLFLKKFNKSLISDLKKQKKYTIDYYNANLMKKHHLMEFRDAVNSLIKAGKINKEDVKPFLSKKKVVKQLLKMK